MSHDGLVNRLLFDVGSILIGNQMPPLDSFIKTVTILNIVADICA